MLDMLSATPTYGCVSSPKDDIDRDVKNPPTTAFSRPLPVVSRDVTLPVFLGNNDGLPEVWNESTEELGCDRTLKDRKASER